MTEEELWDDYVKTLNMYIPIIKDRSEPICYDTFFFVGHRRKEFVVVENDWQYFVLGSLARFLSGAGFLKEDEPEFMKVDPNLTEEERSRLIDECLAEKNNEDDDFRDEDLDMTYELKEFEIDDLLTKEIFDKWREHFAQDVEWWSK